MMTIIKLEATKTKQLNVLLAILELVLLILVLCAVFLVGLAHIKIKNMQKSVKSANQEHTLTWME